MSEQRAILVSREQREDLDGPGYAVTDDLCRAFDAAGDQPRERYCAEHGWSREHRDGGYCEEAFISPTSRPCRVVDAIVCVLP